MQKIIFLIGIIFLLNGCVATMIRSQCAKVCYKHNTRLHSVLINHNSIQCNCIGRVK